MRLRSARRILQLVRREIDDEQAPAGATAPRAASAIARPGSSRKCSTWWMTTRSKLSRSTGRFVHVAEPHARMVDAGALQIGARHRQHGRREVDAERALVAARRRAPACGRCRCRCRAWRGTARRRRAPGSPPRPAAPAHAASGSRPSGWRARRNSAPPPRGSAASGRRAARGRAAASRRPASSPFRMPSATSRAGILVGEAVIDPGAFRAAGDEPGLGEHLQVPRDARLRLAENLGQLLDRALALLQAARAAGCASRRRLPSAG